MHDAGIIHGDIKLDNFIWNGQNLTTIDFGCSYSRDSSKYQPCLAALEDAKIYPESLGVQCDIDHLINSVKQLGIEIEKGLTIAKIKKLVEETLYLS